MGKMGALQPASLRKIGGSLRMWHRESSTMAFERCATFELHAHNPSCRATAPHIATSTCTPPSPCHPPHASTTLLLWHPCSPRATATITTLTNPLNRLLSPWCSHSSRSPTVLWALGRPPGGVSGTRASPSTPSSSRAAAHPCLPPRHPASAPPPPLAPPPRASPQVGRTDGRSGARAEPSREPAGARGPRWWLRRCSRGAHAMADGGGGLRRGRCSAGVSAAAWTVPTDGRSV